MKNFISLDNVTLQFKLRKFRQTSLKSYFLDGMFSTKRNPYIYVDALKDLNLRVDEGERLGVIGHNGAGKSTLLRTLAGVYHPTKGKYTAHGEISSLFNLTLGFEPHSSGWDNIALRGYLQGETPRTMREKTQEIAEFSELGERLNTEVRFYSSGMLVKLGFSIATAFDPQILLIDEILSAGDLAFQAKARQRMNEMIEKASLLVMVSHDITAIKEFCTRAVWMEHGRVVLSGEPDEVAAAYEEKMGGETSVGADEIPAEEAATANETQSKAA